MTTPEMSLTNDASNPLKLTNPLAMLEPIRKQLEEQPFTVINLHPNMADPRAISVAYTIGLARHHLPEIVGLGELDVTSIAIAIEAVALGWLEAKTPTMGKQPSCFEPIDGKELPVALAYIDAEDVVNQEPLALLRAYYGTMPPMAQLLWPDPDGRLPSEDGYRSKEFFQPILKPFQSASSNVQ